MRIILAVLGGLLVGALAVGAAAVTLRPGSADATQAPAASVERGTAEVVLRTLSSTEGLDATLGYDGDGVVYSGLAGTVTAVPDEGDILDQGDVIVEVDGGGKAVLLYGERPAWRRLTKSTRGHDVKQLEEALKDLGYLRKSVKPDQWFGVDTVRAVKAWHKDLGVKRDGAVELGEVTFADGPLRIASLEVELGGSTGPGSVLARTTTGTRVVSLELEADRQDLLAVGDAVDIELPDDSSTTGTVAEIGRVATQDADGSDPTVTVTVALDDPDATGSLDGAPVTVLVTRESREDVVAVPVDALLALQEGGYAVEVQEADGSTRLVGVDLGLFADGLVQVSGGVSAGNEVVVPR